MDDPAAIARLTQALVAIDSRSFVSNLAVAEAVEAALAGFEIERIDYTDPAGTPKRGLVARRGIWRDGARGAAFSGHMDTVPATGWQDDPWSARIDADGVLHGLGATDMKGPVATIITAARSLPGAMPIMLILTTDEEVDKAGAQQIAQRSQMLRQQPPAAIIVAEPTGLAPVRGHRSHINFTIQARGVQAHSSTGRGRNANWALLPFLDQMRALHDRLRSDPTLQDEAYDPPFSDFNLLLENHGAALNVTVPLATARIKYRHSAGINPAPICAAVRAAAEAAGLDYLAEPEAPPPELPATHPLIRLCEEVTGQEATTAPYGTDASELQHIAPCVVLGPGDIGVAHAPGEHVRLAALAAAVPVFQRLAQRLAAG